MILQLGMCRLSFHKLSPSLFETSRSFSSSFKIFWLKISNTKPLLVRKPNFAGTTIISFIYKCFFFFLSCLTGMQIALFIFCSQYVAYTQLWCHTFELLPQDICHLTHFLIIETGKVQIGCISNVFKHTATDKDRFHLSQRNCHH